MEISKEQFERYEKVRKSGKTNMFMVTTVARLSGLFKDEIMEIMKNYSEYEAKYLKK